MKPHWYYGFTIQGVGSCLSIKAFHTHTSVAPSGSSSQEDEEHVQTKQPAEEEDDDDEKPLANLIQSHVKVLVGPSGSIRVHSSSARLVNDPTKTVQFLVSMFPFKSVQRLTRLFPKLWTPLEISHSVKADCLFVSESYSKNSDLPPLAQDFVNQGYRLILPLFDSVAEQGQPLSFLSMVYCIGSVLREVKRQDRLLRMPSVTCSSASRSSISLPDPLPDSASRPRLEPLRMTSSNFKPMRPAIKQRTTCLIGQGYSALIAALYAANLSAPPSTPTTPIKPSKPSLFEHLRARLRHSDPVARFDPPTALEDLRVNACPAISALVLVSPKVEILSPSTVGSFDRIKAKFSHQDLKRLPLGGNNAKAVAEAIRQLRTQSNRIQVPTLMIQGLADPRNSSQATVSLYESIR